ncbi:MAG: response regulator [Flavobacteriales bacterium]|nr:response regulator [Flavobacteriales bacterium]
MKSLKSPKIFIVEDDPFYQEIIRNELLVSDYVFVEAYSNGQECIDNLNLNPDIILLDYNLGEDMNGIEVLKKIKKINPSIEVIMLSAQERMKVAVNSIQFGAFDYVIKTDLAMRRIVDLVNRICKWNQLIYENKMNKIYQRAITAGIGVFCAAVFILSYIYPEYFD